MRKSLVLIHRYVGLVLAGFLVIAGLTGSLLVWYHELDRWFNPQLMQVEPVAGSTVLDPMVLRERVAEAFPAASVHYVPLRTTAADEALTFYVAPKSDREDELPFDEVFIDPYTGNILGTRLWGDLSQGVVNLMPFIYRLHYSLALGTIGTYTFGVIALVWTLDCFIGAYLTLPRRNRREWSGQTSWFRRWRPAWRVRWRAGSFKRDFDLHSAGGLWPWALLFVLAWSSVAFNLHDQVYRPVTTTVFEMQESLYKSHPDLTVPWAEPPLGWVQGLAIAQQRMAELAAEKGFTVLGADRLAFDADKGFLRYVAKTDRDIGDRYGQTSVFIDARTGVLLGSHLPTGEAAGDTITHWLYTLHMAQVWGFPFRLIMTAMGIVVVMLSITGVLIWWRKRSARSRTRLRRNSCLESRNQKGAAPVPNSPRLNG